MNMKQINDMKFFSCYRIEAQKCDDIVVVEIDKDKLKKQTYDIKTVSIQ